MLVHELSADDLLCQRSAFGLREPFAASSRKCAGNAGGASRLGTQRKLDGKPTFLRRGHLPSHQEQDDASGSPSVIRRPEHLDNRQRRSRDVGVRAVCNADRSRLEESKLASGGQLGRVLRPRRGRCAGFGRAEHLGVVNRVVVPLTDRDRKIQRKQDGQRLRNSCQSVLIEGTPWHRNSVSHG
jgi:hypothetical protein